MYLSVLAQIMGWRDRRCREEFAWIRLMDRFRYDTYRDFCAGAGFVERLADWLQQYHEDDRETAYQFVRRNLVYIGPGQIRQLVELMVPRYITPWLVDRVANLQGIPTYSIWASNDTRHEYRLQLRKTLFLGLSDGARVDTFRRANVGLISNEQVVVGTQIGRTKWRDLLKKLRKHLGDDTARFESLVLIDDFTASGKTLIRKKPDGQWSGKLNRLWEDLVANNGTSLLNTHFAKDFTMHVHHYLATSVAAERAKALSEEARTERQPNWFPEITFSFGHIFNEDFPITRGAFLDLITKDDRYYDGQILTESMGVGTGDGRLGFDEGALPLVLEHNCPNNSLALIWAETEGAENVHSMRPLFRRRARHS